LSRNGINDGHSRCDGPLAWALRVRTCIRSVRASCRRGPPPPPPPSCRVGPSESPSCSSSAAGASCRSLVVWLHREVKNPRRHLHVPSPAQRTRPGHESVVYRIPATAGCPTCYEAENDHTLHHLAKITRPFGPKRWWGPSTPRSGLTEASPLCAAAAITPPVALRFAGHANRRATLLGKFSNTVRFSVWPVCVRALGVARAPSHVAEKNPSELIFSVSAAAALNIAPPWPVVHEDRGMPIVADAALLQQTSISWQCRPYRSTPFREIPSCFAARAVTDRRRHHPLPPSRSARPVDKRLQCVCRFPEAGCGPCARCNREGMS